MATTLAPSWVALLHSAPSHVTEAGDADLLAGDVLASLVEKVLGEI